MNTEQGKQYAVVTVADKAEGKLSCYSASVYSEEEYSKIEKDIQKALSSGDSIYKKKKLDDYVQKRNKGKVQGAYDFINNVIHVMEHANESTMIHEAAHWWLTMLEQVVSDDAYITDETVKKAREQAAKDLLTIRAWAGYSPSAMDEYKGTALEKEFKTYEKAIKRNPKDKDAQERFMQERFARAFERYLMTGRAPTKELQRPFRRFKKWLCGKSKRAL